MWSPAAQQTVGSGTELVTKPINKTVMGDQAKECSMSRQADSACLTLEIITSTSVRGGQGSGRAPFPSMKLARARSTFNYKIRLKKQVIH